MAHSLVTRMKWRFVACVLALPLCLGIQSACTQGIPPGAGVSPPARAHDPGIARVWLPLVYRLEDEGISGPDVDGYFLALGGEITQDPMGR
ncbi:MAG: hypothetical protein FWG59_04010, partial [Betaproteobacteria bacterium]|nr:hypothetical protein [Betaproteobacteria bacterium]